MFIFMVINLITFTLISYLKDFLKNQSYLYERYFKDFGRSNFQSLSNFHWLLHIIKKVFKSLRKCKRRNLENFTLDYNSNNIKLCRGGGG